MPSGPFIDQAVLDVLLVERDDGEALRLRTALTETHGPHIRLSHAASLGDAIAMLSGQQFRAVVLNLSLPDSTGTNAVDGMANVAGDVPVLVLIDHHEEAVGREAVLRGADDYRVKSPDLYRAIPRILEDVVYRRQLKTANARLRRSRGDAELLLSNVLSVVEVGVAIVGANGKLLVANPTLGDMTGWSVGELVGRSVSDMFAEGSLDWSRIADEDAKRHGADYQEDDVRMVRKTGETFAVRLRSAEVNLAQDQIINVVAFYRNHANRPVGAASQSSGASFQDEVRRILGNSAGEVSTGHLQIVGLDAVRSRLGDRWEKLAERVHDLAERTIRARLGPEDTFTRTKDGAFLLCFGRLSEEEAWLKASSIGDEIRQKLLGTLGSEEPMTAELSDEHVERLADVSVDAHRLRVSSAETAEPVDLADLIVGKLKSAAQKIREKAQLILLEMQETSQIYMREALKKSGHTAPFLVQDFDTKTLLQVDHLRHASDDPEAFFADMDFFALGKTAEYLHRSISAHSPRVVVGVHVTTLANGLTLEKYLGICEALALPIRRSIVFNLKGLTLPAAPSWVQAILDRLTPYSSFRMIDLSNGVGRSLELAGTDVPIFSIDYERAHKGGVARRSSIQKLAERIHQRKAYLLADRVPKRLDPAAMYRLGVDLVAFDHR